MKAIVQEGYGSADVLHLREVDRPVAADDGVLIRVLAASVNAADYHLVHGGAIVRGVAWAMRTPVLPIRGADVAGIVEVAGKDVTRLKRGDEVFGVGAGSFAEYTTAAEDRLAPKPAGLSQRPRRGRKAAPCDRPPVPLGRGPRGGALRAHRPGQSEGGHYRRLMDSTGETRVSSY